MPKVLFDNIGNADSRCPYCNHLFEKMPVRKKKCPNCGNDIFVRTKPDNREKILVTETQIPLVEQQWSKFYEQKEKEKLERDPEYLDVKQRLMKKWGKEPSMNDVKWSLANQNLIHFSKNNNWGLYRNTRLEMADILQKETRLKESLRTYLDVFYIDVNGPSNRGGINDPQFLKDYPPFDPRQSILAPAVIRNIKELVNELELYDEFLKDIFMDNANISYSLLNLPIDPVSAWKKLHDVIEIGI